MRKIINLAKTWTDRFGSKRLNENKTTEPMLIWASGFFNLLQLTAREKSLVQATVVIKRPPTLATILTNYKKVAHSTTENIGKGSSQPCKKCFFCLLLSIIFGELVAILLFSVNLLDYAD